MLLKERISEDMKNAMRSGEKDRLAVIRLLQAAIKQREVDERITLDDAQVARVARAIRATGAVDEVERLIDDLAHEALSLLAEQPWPAPAADVLTRLAHAAVDRRA